MSDDVSQHLAEIAALLRQRIEVAERAQRFQEERHQDSQVRASQMMERFQAQMPKIELPNLGFDEEDHRQSLRRIEQSGQEDRQEHYQFHERLLAAMERQTSVLERILTRLEKMP